LRQAQEQSSDEAVLLGALARLWTSGVEIDWPEFTRGQRRLRVSLPTYAFARTHHWVDPEMPNRVEMRRMKAQNEYLDFSDWFHMPTWKRSRPVATAN